MEPAVPDSPSIEGDLLCVDQECIQNTNQEEKKEYSVQTELLKSK